MGTPVSPVDNYLFIIQGLTSAPMYDPFDCGLRIKKHPP